MATNYLKKTRFLALAQKLVDNLENVKLKDCSYHFHRGTEWLEFYNNDCYYKFCKMGKDILFHQYIYDEDLEDRKEILYCVFNIDVKSFIETGVLVVIAKYKRVG